MYENVERFRTPEGSRVDLEALPTRVERVYESKSDYKTMLREQTKRLSERQRTLYAADSHALLLIFQAMDTAGKDGAIRHVMSGVNPQGCQVHSFGHPSAQDLDHDFLWRTTLALPERGRIGIFNRSYYEEVLIVRVHPDILAAQRLPEDGLDHPDAVWKQRYESIREHERHLTANGTRVVKFFLHISPKEQRKRLLARIDDPEKNWKFNMADIDERGYWREYMQAYEQCIAATSTAAAPWYVVPADDKRNARLFVSRIVLNAIEGLHIELPSLSPEREADLVEARKRLG